MAGMKKMRMRKATKDNMITYLMVAVLFIVMQGLSLIHILKMAMWQEASAGRMKTII